MCEEHENEDQEGEKAWEKEHMEISQILGVGD